MISLMNCEVSVILSFGTWRRREGFIKDVSYLKLFKVVTDHLTDSNYATFKWFLVVVFIDTVLYDLEELVIGECADAKSLKEVFFI